MSIKWDALLSVFGVSLGATVAVVVLVTLAMLGLATRTAGAGGGSRPFRPPAVGTAVTVVCLAAAATIVLFGLWVMVGR